MNNVACLEDNLFTATNEITDQFRSMPLFKNIFTVILGLAMDSLALTCFYKWITNIHRSWTFPLALCSVYATKLIIQVQFHCFKTDDVDDIHDGDARRLDMGIPRDVFFDHATIRGIKQLLLLPLSGILSHNHVRI